MGGPQFSSAEFADFTKKWVVHLQLLTLIYTQSNGHAEAAVKSMKVFLSKSPKSDRIDSEKFLRGLLEWKNTLRANGLSTAEMVFGHNIRSILVYVVFHRTQAHTGVRPAPHGMVLTTAIAIRYFTWLVLIMLILLSILFLAICIPTTKFKKRNANAYCMQS